MSRARGNRDRKRKGKRAQRKSRRGAQLALANPHERRVRVRLRAESLEVIAGHDGFLRGQPEPVVIAAAYYCAGDSTRLAARTLFSYKMLGDAPTWAEPEERQQPWAQMIVAQQEATIVVLAVAVEHDGGADIAKLYGAIGQADELLVWPLQGSDAVPRHLAGIVDWVPPELSLQVGLHGPGGPPVDSFSSDDYIGTAVAWIPSPAGRKTRDLSMPIVSRDGRNHWVVNLRLAVG